MSLVRHYRIMSSFLRVFCIVCRIFVVKPGVWKLKTPANNNCRGYLWRRRRVTKHPAKPYKFWDYSHQKPYEKQNLPKNYNFERYFASGGEGEIQNAPYLGNICPILLPISNNLYFVFDLRQYRIR